MSAGQHRVMQAAYGAMIEHVDAQMGRILATLDAIGQRDNTIVVFHNDHGEFLGDHGTYYKGPFLYDCCIRTPLIWRWPNRIAAGVRRSALVELVDVAPTLMALCGMREQCLGMQGTDLSALLRDEAHPDSHKAAVYAEYLHDSLPGHADGTVLSAMYRTTTHKLIHWAGKQYGELYALGVDPEECVNEWKNPALGEVRSQMHEAMCGHLVGMVDPLPPRTGMY